LRTWDGDAEVSASIGDLDVETSDGDIRIDSFDGPVTAQTSDGDIHLSLDVALQPCHLQTSDGDIDIRLDLSSALTFDCRVADGQSAPICPSSVRRGITI
jgi:DUF4097 and DUF4098 domain-containing protein YvlB